jgi:TPR repeat protein
LSVVTGVIPFAFWAAYKVTHKVTDVGYSKKLLGIIQKANMQGPERERLEQGQKSLKLERAEARYTLGQIYQGVIECEDNEIVISDVEALKYYKLAADDGHLLSQIAAAKICDTWSVETYDRGEALRYYELAFKQGDLSVLKELISFCERDLSEIRSPSRELRLPIRKKMFEYWKFAADLGNAEAQFEVATALLNGRGTGKDLNKSIKYYELAAKQNYPEAAGEVVYLELIIANEATNKPQEENSFADDSQSKLDSTKSGLDSTRSQLET